MQGVLVPEHQALAAPSSSEVNAARETYREGVALESAGNWAGALAKFQSVASVKSTPRVRFHIGLCQENLGRWNEALGAYKMAIAEANAEHARDVVKEAEAAKAKLEGKIPRLTLRRSPGAEGAGLSLDGVELGSATIGVEMPIDPGNHSLVVRMAGREVQRITVEIGEGEHKTFDVQPPAASGPSTQPTVSASTVAPIVSAEPEQGQPARSSTLLPWIVTGLGAASLATSGVFYLLRSGAVSDLENRCGASLQCTESDRSLYDRGRTYTLVANVTLGVGIVGLGVGTVLLLASSGAKAKQEPRVSHPSARFDPTMNLMVHPTGVSLVGQF
jgi:hypothetical protein